MSQYLLNASFDEFIHNNTDIARIICSYLDTDSDLFYLRVMELFEKCNDYSYKKFFRLYSEVPKIFAIPRYLKVFKERSPYFKEIYQSARIDKEKRFDLMKQGPSFTSEWIITTYH